MCCRYDLVVFFIHYSLPSTLNKKKKGGNEHWDTNLGVGRMGVKSRLASHLKLSLASSLGCWALSWSPSKELFQMHPLLPWVKTLRICTAWGGLCQTIPTCIHPPLSVRGATSTGLIPSTLMRSFPTRDSVVFFYNTILWAGQFFIF